MIEGFEIDDEFDVLFDNINETVIEKLFFNTSGRINDTGKRFLKIIETLIISSLDVIVDISKITISTFFKVVKGVLNLICFNYSYEDYKTYREVKGQP